jgi:hypothetical protein
MNVQELLESQISQAEKELKRLEKEEELATYMLQKTHNNRVDAELHLAELQEALDLWIDQ